MSIFQEILNTYAQFFDLAMWMEVLSDPISWGLIGSIVILEGLLSADNALVLAVMVKHLPEKQRRKALFFGLVGAYLFRFIAIGIGVYLIELWWVKVLGAGYLAWLSISHFIEKRKNNNILTEELDKIEGVKQDGILIRLFGSFWGTVIAVELVDIAFSVDSVLAAFGVSQEIWVLLFGGMIGILMMRGIAGVILKLIDKIPELETTAYIIILVISAKMFVSLTGYELEHRYFFLLLVIIFLATFLIHITNKYKNNKQL